MSAISGKDGKVQIDAADAAQITGWTFNPTSNNPAWASSDTNGFKDRVGGVKDGSGSFEAKYDDASEVWDTITEGSEMSLGLFLHATVSITVPAIVDGINYEVDINDGEVVAVTVDYSTRGEWTYP